MRLTEAGAQMQWKDATQVRKRPGEAGCQGKAVFQKRARASCLQAWGEKPHLLTPSPGCPRSWAQLAALGRRGSLCRQKTHLCPYPSSTSDCLMGVSLVEDGVTYLRPWHKGGWKSQHQELKLVKQDSDAGQMQRITNIHSIQQVSTLRKLNQLIDEE